MKALLLVAALLAGQHTTDPEPTSTPQIQSFSVNHEGMDFTVHGWRDQERGTIHWLPSDDFNRRSYAAAVAAKSAPKNYGVSPNRRHVPKASPTATMFIEEATSLVKSAVSLHLTVIGTDSDREQVMKDLEGHPAFASLKSRLSIQGYRPDHWAISPSLGFQTQGKPSIIVQQARGPGIEKAGKVVYRALDYSMGPVALASAVATEVRRVDPTYDPSGDPGPASGGGLHQINFLTSDQMAYCLTGVVVLVVFMTLPRRAG